MLGGLSRRVAYVEKMRRENPSLLVVDSGDLFFDFLSNADSERALKKAQLISQAYRCMKVAAVNVGDLDLLQGIDFLRNEFSKGVPLISANLLDPSKQNPIFPPYVLRDISGLRVAFFGLLPPESRPEVSSAIRRANEGKILIKDPVEAARETMQTLQGKADLVILLSDLGLYRDQGVAREVAGIPFILGGHEGRFLMRPNQQGGTYLMQSSAKGMNVGKLHLTIRKLTSPFEDKAKPEKLRQQILGMEYRLRTLRQERERQPSESIDRAMRSISQQRIQLQEELKRAQDNFSRGNWYNWTLQALDMSFPEDKEVQRWIEEAGVDKD